MNLPHRRLIRAGFGLAAALITALITAGCMNFVPVGKAQSEHSGSVYSGREALGEMQVRYGRVISTRAVMIERDQTGVGMATGAVLGGIAGSNAGGGSGRAAATVVGAVAGGMIGSAAETRMRGVHGTEIVIELERSGEQVAIVQESAPELTPGDRVRITGSGRNVRVSR